MSMMLIWIILTPVFCQTEQRNMPEPRRENSWLWWLTNIHWDINRRATDMCTDNYINENSMDVEHNTLLPIPNLVQKNIIYFEKAML